MGISIDLTNTERRVSTAEFALRMNISEKELYDRIKTGRVKRPIKDGRKNYWLNSYVLPVLFMRKTPLLRQNEIAVVLSQKRLIFLRRIFSIFSFIQ
jgi:predicted DNA-binding transcriptional regulator AlpA